MVEEESLAWEELLRAMAEVLLLLLLLLLGKGMGDAQLTTAEGGTLAGFVA